MCSCAFILLPLLEFDENYNGKTQKHGISLQKRGQPQQEFIHSHECFCLKLQSISKMEFLQSDRLHLDLILADLVDL